MVATASRAYGRTRRPAPCALSARLAKLLPGTPAYPYQAIHSSIGNISAPDGRLVDPDRNQEDRVLLERLAGAVEKALAAPPKAVDGCMVDFGPALLSPRMALVFGRSQPGYWALHQAVQAARDHPLPAVNAPRVSAARRRSTGRAFTIVVDGLEPAQVLLHKRCSDVLTIG